jgi:type III secretion protein D
LFRVNGLAVETRYDAGGVVVVSGFREAGPEVAKISAHALRDVRGLASIRLEVPADPRDRRRLVLAAAEPNERRAPAAPASYGRIDPNTEAMGRGGKRITVVVQAERPYVVTADGRRYFVGSVLPHGYRLAEISGSSVRLERDGEVVVRTF